jgi:hypothetical protein
MDDSTPSTFYRISFECFCFCRRPLDSTRPSLLCSCVLACLCCTLRVFCFTLFQQHECQWLQMCLRDGTNKEAFYQAKARHFLDVISNVSYTRISSGVSSIMIRTCNVENLKFGRSANGVTPSRYVIVVFAGPSFPSLSTVNITPCLVSGMHDQSSLLFSSELVLDFF